MKALKPDQLIHQTIINNIKRLRNEKGFTSQEMAHKIEMAPCEYSKLENGHKQYIEKWLAKIADVLKVDIYELIIEHSTKSIKQSYIAPELEEFMKKQFEINRLLFKALDERDKAKDDTILILKEDKKYWYDKYYRNKKRLEDCERLKLPNPINT